MKKDIQEILNYDIIENVGIGDVQFGMSEKYFLELYDVKKGVKDNIFVDNNRGSYYFKDRSIYIDFNIEKKLYSIGVYTNFQGKLNGKIGIGSYFGELRALRKDIRFCDDFDGYILGTGYRFQFMLDEDEYPTGELNGEFIAPAWHWHRDFHKGKLDHYKIESISMEAWNRSNANHTEWWCDYLDDWVEPEDKYLEIRYT